MNTDESTGRNRRLKLFYMTSLPPVDRRPLGYSLSTLTKIEVIMFNLTLCPISIRFGAICSVVIVFARAIFEPSCLTISVSL